MKKRQHNTWIALVALLFFILVAGLFLMYKLHNSTVGNAQNDMESTEQRNTEQRNTEQRSTEQRSAEPNVVDRVEEDFDRSGQKDLCLMKVNESEDSTTLYFYMNDAPVYEVTIPEVNCLFVDIVSGDIDHDGNTEIIYLANTGGNGGSGSYAKGILKYKNDSLEPMELPGDFSEEEKTGQDEGFSLEISYGDKDGTYLVNCPSLGESREIQSRYSTYEDGSFFVPKHIQGEIAGANCRGYYTFEIVTIDGLEYLAAEEYFFWRSRRK